ncbi:MAG: phenylalanine--tRNA ligase subunit beta [bacterium]|nr:phenylalanine--tRNA ligase subunit beta [bacterium]
MIFSYSWLQELVSSKLPVPSELADVLNAHAFEVEEVEKRGGEWLLNLSVLPNRAGECTNHLGMAREIAAILKSGLKMPPLLPMRTQKGSLAPLEVSVRDLELVPRYAAFVVEGVEGKDSPAWMKKRLELVGVNSINALVDISNYVMLEMGQPLHVFDYDEIRGGIMRLKKVQEGEEIATLEGGIHRLPAGTLVIEDAERLIDLAGIKGGAVSGVSQGTRNVVFQAATFEKFFMYASRKRIGLETPAAVLYGYGIDPNLADEALARTASLLRELGVGGKIVQNIDIYPKKIRPRKIALELERVNSLLGKKVPEGEAMGILKRLGFSCTKKGPGRFAVEVPTRRQDVQLPEDLIEEIGRISGYENIFPQLPTEYLIPPEPNERLLLEEDSRDVLREAGFTETYGYSFIGEKDLSLFAYTSEEAEGLAEVENPISSEYRYLRDSLLPNQLRALAQNVAHGRQGVRFFEAGTSFARMGEKFSERRLLAGVLQGDAFFEAKGVVDFLLERLGSEEAWYDTSNQAPSFGPQGLWDNDRSAEIKIAGRRIGFVGSLSAQIAARLKIPRAAMFELDTEMLGEIANTETEYHEPSKFPSVLRDIAVFVPHDVKVADVLNVMEPAGGELVADIDLFDLYDAEELGEGRKSMAFHITFQSQERTLKGSEVDQAESAMREALKANPEWEVR